MNQNTIEIAISALEAEKAKIVEAIAELKGGRTGGKYRPIAGEDSTGGRGDIP